MSLTESLPALAAVRRARELSQPAFITVFDEAAVAAAAGAATDLPLAGMPVAIKDNIDVAGVPSTAACPRLTTPATHSATAVSRLVAAGAVPIAKTNMDQFATGLAGTRSPYGACHSVASSAHISGGSSSGSAVAVAAGVVPLALGTDTAGSGRVPAAFNGLVGFKPTRGLIPTTGVLPACQSLDCITTLTRTVALARTAFEVLAGPDDADPYSRRIPVSLPDGVAQEMRVIGVPSGELTLDDGHFQAWQRALVHASGVARIVPVDITPMLEAGRLLYDGPMLAERLAAIGDLLVPDGPELDPTVRSIVLGAAALTGAATYDGLHQLAEYAAKVQRLFSRIDALVLPTTPGHPTLAEVAVDPTGVNARMGTYTNMVNLLDLCAVAVPAGTRSDGLPFGVQLIAPAFADRPLLDLASRWCGEDRLAEGPTASRTLLAVAGAHLSGQPLNGRLIELGGRLHSRRRTAPGYRMYFLPGTPPRPALLETGDGPARGIEIELWDLPDVAIGDLSVLRPLTLGPLRLDDGSSVTGFITTDSTVAEGTDISHYGSWTRYLDRVHETGPTPGRERGGPSCCQPF